jgi:hypothetical protein
MAGKEIGVPRTSFTSPVTLSLSKPHIATQTAISTPSHLSALLNSPPLECMYTATTMDTYYPTVSSLSIRASSPYMTSSIYGEE